MKHLRPKLAIIAVLLVLAAFSRLFSIAPNFTPMCAIALVSGALINNRILAFVFPLLAMLLGDLLTITLINYKYISIPEYFAAPYTALIYLSFFGMTMIGFWLRKRKTWSNLGIASFAGPTLFFLTTNFGEWTHNNLPKTFSGLMQTYELGIPFYRNDVLGTFVFSFLFFGVLVLLTQYNPKLQEQKIK
jgi:hypothetical protein